MGVIYAIQHNATKKMYIGQTNDLYRRYKGHLSGLRKNKHHSKKMQEDYNKYGEDYSLFVLEEIKDLNERTTYKGTSCSVGTVAEIEWMQRYGTLDDGYNVQDNIARRMACRKDFPIKEGLPIVQSIEQTEEG